MDNSWDSVTNYANPQPQESDWGSVANYSPSQPEPQSDWGGVVQYGSPAPAQDISQDPWDNFKQKATQIAKERNYPAGVLLGQAALETARGASNFARTRHNYFGYQAYDSDPNQAKAYNGPEESINDYLDLIQKTPRYSWAYQQYLQDQNPENLITNIWKSGYATDPNYVNKIKSMPEFNQ